MWETRSRLEGQVLVCADCRVCVSVSKATCSFDGSFPRGLSARACCVVALFFVGGFPLTLVFKLYLSLEKQMIYRDQFVLFRSAVANQWSADPRQVRGVGPAGLDGGLSRYRVAAWWTLHAPQSFGCYGCRKKSGDFVKHLHFLLHAYIPKGKVCTAADS